MGSAIAHSILTQHIAERITVIEPAQDLPLNLGTHKNVAHYNDLSAAGDLSSASVCLLAVKPQVMDNICAALKNAINADCLLLSIAAGKTIAGFETLFSNDTPIIRAMPNTPAMIGEGISVLCANGAVDEDNRDAATAILEACGAVEWVDDEAHIDAVTAISGSGPAYLFYFIETLEAAAIARGLPPVLAANLARQTVIGSAALAKAQADTAPATLRENVTSPNGTTAAALEVLMNGEFKDILNRTTAAAQKRSRALS